MPGACACPGRPRAPTCPAAACCRGHAAARRLQYAACEAQSGLLGRAGRQLTIRRRAPTRIADRELASGPTTSPASRRCARQVGTATEVTRHPVLRGARNSGQVRGQASDVSTICGCLRRRAQQNHRARNMVRRRRQDPGRTLQSQLGGLRRSDEGLNRQADSRCPRSTPTSGTTRSATVEKCESAFIASAGRGSGLQGRHPRGYRRGRAGICREAHPSVCAGQPCGAG